MSEQVRRKLKAAMQENARLQAEVERLQNNCDYLDQKLDEEIDKSAMLCGHVMRLTKAGDAMANNIPYYADVDISAETLREFTEKWHSAKEGKQS